MALAHEDNPRCSSGTPTRLSGTRHHGRSALAEVVPIRSKLTPGAQTPASMVTRIAQVFATLRTQATPVVSPPLPPSSP